MFYIKDSSLGLLKLWRELKEIFETQKLCLKYNLHAIASVEWKSLFLYLRQFKKYFADEWWSELREYFSVCHEFLIKT